MSATGDIVKVAMTPESVVLEQATKLAGQDTGWAVAVIVGIVFGGVILLLYKELRNKDKALTEISVQLAKIGENFVSSNREMTAAVQQVGVTGEARTRALEELARDTDRNSAEQRHGHANLQQVLTTIAEKVVNQTDLIKELLTLIRSRS